MTRKLRTFALLGVIALILAACSPADEGAETSTTEDMTTTTEAMTSTTAEMMADTVYDVAVGNEDFSTLIAAVDAAGLQDALADPEATLTVFAPTNEAFEAALTALGLTAEELLADTETLTSILTYHVLGETVTSADLAAAGTEEITVSTLNGEDLTVVVGEDGTVSFADQTATVTTADVEASNGVIHVIDAVLLPPAMQG
ncbi:MAG TPA: fasciclin domain-containing protein [Acidimicrobiia bacterium]|nr:fasciclin domain-containing protein [Acidimicrobiia bacterium]